VNFPISDEQCLESKSNGRSTMESELQDIAAAGMFVVGIGGSTRPLSSTELVVRAVLERLERQGAATALYAGERLLLPPYEQTPACADACRELIADVRRADAVVVGSPGYHGSMSGLVKNALDYLEELRDDDRPYLDGRPVGCISTAYGWQAAVNTLTTLRQIVHALRGWPTPYGITLNVADGLAQDNGRVSDPNIEQAAEVMAMQISSFASAMSADSRRGRP
jgi:FMN reductase